MSLNNIIESNIENIMISNNFDCELIKEDIKNITIEYMNNEFKNNSSFSELIDNVFLAKILESEDLPTITNQEIIDKQETLINMIKEKGESSEYNILGNMSKYITIGIMAYIIYNRSRNSIEFVFYKMEFHKLFKFFKNSEYFPPSVITKLLKYDNDFEACSDYGRYTTPLKILISERESFKLRHCFIKYIGSTFLYLLRQYKDYLKFKNVPISGKLDSPESLITIRNEQINVELKNSLYKMNKIVNVFLDDVYKNRLNILFKLVISDNFDISRFEFDDFK